jgi:hypothetical protein
MPTLNLQVGASSDDVWASNKDTTPEGLTTSVISFVGQGGSTGCSGFRFTGATIPQGATISAATLTLKAQASYSTGSAITGRVACQAADNAAAFAASSGNLNTTNRPRTAYSTDWSLQSVTGETDYSKDITAQVQAVINRAGWASGNALVVLIDDNGSALSEWQDFYSYDNTPAKAAKLDITYSTGSSAAGDLTFTLDGLTLQADASAPEVGDFAFTLNGLTLQADATAPVVGDLSFTLDGLSLQAASGSGAIGDFTFAFDGLTLQADASAPVAGALTFALDGLSLTADAITTAYKNPNVQVGDGYTDVSRQLVRTSTNRVYIVATNCDAYPCTSLTQTVRVFRADQTGIPTTFTRQDSANEPAAAGAVTVAIDASDNIHIAWHNRSGNDSIKYAVFNTSTNIWGTVENVDADLGAPADSGQGDMLLGLSLDADSVPHVVYLKHDGTRRRVNYRNRIGGTWSAATVVDDQAFGANDRCWHPSIAHDYEGRIVVVWLIGTFNDSLDGTIYVKTRESGGAWNTTAQVSPTDDALTGIDQSASLLITEGNRYHIAYMRASATPGLKYIRYYYSDNDGASWTANAPGGGTQATHNPTLGPNGRGGIRIWGHGTPDAGNHGENIYYFDSDGGAAAWSAWTLFVTGTNYDSSVSTRWQRYHFSQPGYVDIAYWNDAYPNVLYYGGEHVAQSALSFTLDGLTLVGEGSGGAAIGDLSFTLEGLTLQADAVAPVAADLTFTLDGLTLQADATAPVVGDATFTLGDLSLQADGAALGQGELTFTLDGLSLQADGEAPTGPVGTLVFTLDGLALTAEASAPVAGDAILTLDGLSLQADGAALAVGDLIFTLDGLTLTAAENQPFTGVPIITRPIMVDLHLPSVNMDVMVASILVEAVTPLAVDLYTRHLEADLFVTPIVVESDL